MLRSILTYGAAEAIARGMNWGLLALLPLLLSPELYGLVALIIAIESIASGVLVLGQDRAVLRYYGDHEDRDLLFSTVVIGNTVTTAIVLGVAWLVGWAATEGRVLDIPLWPDLALLGIAVLLFNVNRLYLSALRVDGAARTYALHRTTFGLLKGGAVISFALWGAGYTSYVFGLVAATVVVLVLEARDLLARTSCRIDTTIVRRVTSFGWPVALHVIAAKVLMFIDRVMLAHFMGAASVGIYSLGYTLGTCIGFAYAALAVHYEPLIYRYVDDITSSEAILWQYTIVSFVVGTAGGAFLLGILPAMFGSLFSPEYSPAALVVPIVLVAQLVYPIYLQANFRLSSYGKTRDLALGSGIAAASNVGLNWALIPRFGYLGAAWATTISVLVLVSVVFIRSVANSPVPLGMVRHVGTMLGMCVICAILLVTPTFAQKSVVLALAMLVMMAVGWRTLRRDVSALRP